MNGMKEASRNEVALDCIFPLLLIVCSVKGTAQSYYAPLGQLIIQVEFEDSFTDIFYTWNLRLMFLRYFYSHILYS